MILYKLWATISTVDGLGNRLTTHEASFHVTAEQINAIVSRIDKAEDDLGIIDSTIKTAGWITTADGNKLWATIDRVDVLGNRLTTHESSFHVTAEQINAIVSRVDTIDGTISKAGWITTADGNKLWATKELEKGETLISYINQAAGSTVISSNKISLIGAVSFNSLNADLQATLNGKLSAGDFGSLAFKDAVEYAQLGSTIIVGGYLNADLIKVRRVDADAGFIGGFTIEGGRLVWTRSGYFGGTSRSLKLGSGTAKEGVVNITFDVQTDGKFGVCSIGSSLGGACIYASRYSNESDRSYPVSNNTYAGYFDGGVHVKGNVYCDAILANEIGVSWYMEGGTYKYTKGLSKTLSFEGGTRWQFVNGLLVSA